MGEAKEQAGVQRFPWEIQTVLDFKAVCVSGTWGSMRKRIFCTIFFDCIDNQKLEVAVWSRETTDQKRVIYGENNPLGEF